MLLRIWKVGISPGQANALESFANSVSLPMFQAQPGCLAVLFTRTESECATVTLWSSAEAVEAMEASAHYRDVVLRIEQSGILGSDHRTEVFTVYGGFASEDVGSLLAARTR